MNYWITPTMMLRWSGLGLLGCLLAIGAYSMRARDACCLSVSAEEGYATALHLGMWIAGVSFAVVGIGMLTAKAPVTLQPQNESIGHRS
ncbi:hypothetical protein [Nocardioides sp. GXQ0305]|uniref:hypothetical protein n=1 Tax=Nocardioides sp. GXQ0305 TaxID=3423912 RepID=UPI003D7C5129